jgi:hypothetical protein
MSSMQDVPMETLLLKHVPLWYTEKSNILVVRAFE